MPRRLLVSFCEKILPVFATVAFAQGCGQIKTPDPKPYLGNPKPPTTSELRWSNGKRPKSADPALAAAPPETDLARALFDGLTEIDPATLEPMPALAEKWEHSNDWRTWRFYLRDNAFWSNGERVTADDFVRSWKRYAEMGAKAAFPELLVNLRKARSTAAEKKQQPQLTNNPSGEGNANLQAGSKTGESGRGEKIAGQGEAARLDNQSLNVTAESDRILRVELGEPDPDLPSLTAHPVFRPVFDDGQQFRDFSENAREIVTNGAFRIEQISDREISLVPFEKYWDRDAVKLQRVRMIAAEPEEALERYRAGELDAVSNADLSPAAMKLLEPYEDFRRVTHAALNFYEINISKFPLSDRRIRLALAMAIERERLVEGELQGTVRPAYEMLPFRQRPEQRIPQDISAAKSLMAAAGFPDGSGFPSLRLIINRNDLQLRIARAVTRMWKQNLGIDAEIVVREQNELGTIRTSGDFDLIRRGVVFAVPDELVALAAIYDEFAGFESASGYESAKGPTEGRYKPGNERQSRAVLPSFGLADLATSLWRDVRAIPLYYPTAVSLAKPYVTGMEPNNFDIVLLKRVEIDK